jgi:methionyl-tRNA formyltransferase
MIFIGSGALLTRAITHTISKGYRIDMVFSNTKEINQVCEENNILFKETADINNQVDHFESDDKVVFSINSYQILKQKLLELPGYRFYNVHNGILPEYRGLPELCVIHAILNRAEKYGVSLHLIDNGVDTGTCYATKEFPLSGEDTFQSIMLKAIYFCHEIFVENLEKIMANKLECLPIGPVKSKLYTYRDLERLKKDFDPALVSRVLNFGVFVIWFKPAYEILKKRIE